MGLIAGVMEQHGIATVCVALVRSVAQKVGPPRALAVPFRFGAPLGEANDEGGQLAVMRAAVRLLDEIGPPPALRDYRVGSVG